MPSYRLKQSRTRKPASSAQEELLSRLLKGDVPDHAVRSTRSAREMIERRTTAKLPKSIRAARRAAKARRIRERHLK